MEISREVSHQIVVKVALEFGILKQDTSNQCPSFYSNIIPGELC